MENNEIYIFYSVPLQQHRKNFETSKNILYYVIKEINIEYTYKLRN